MWGQKHGMNSRGVAHRAARRAADHLLRHAPHGENAFVRVALGGARAEILLGRAVPEDRPGVAHEGRHAEPEQTTETREMREAA